MKDSAGLESARESEVWMVFEVTKDKIQKIWGGTTKLLES